MVSPSFLPWMTCWQCPLLWQWGGEGGVDSSSKRLYHFFKSAFHPHATRLCGPQGPPRDMLVSSP